MTGTVTMEIMGLLTRWRQWRAGAPRRRTARAIAAVRRESYWLAKRPFSDKYDGDRSGGYFSSPGGQYGGEEEALRKRRNWR